MALQSNGCELLCDAYETAALGSHPQPNHSNVVTEVVTQSATVVMQSK
jgi:7,8-dihydro-6-hydroxymethylpterin-pyrophosphokinase